MEFMDLVRERYSCRRYSQEPVEQEKIDAILEAANVAPTGCDNQPFKIWVLRSDDACEKMRSAIRFHFGAPMFMVVGANREEAFTRDIDGRNFADIDATIAATHALLAIADQGLGACWVGYFDQKRLKELFPQMQGYDLLAVFPMGYPAENAHPAKLHGKRKGIGAIAEYL